MNSIPRSEYPRPIFRRESFQSLNGEWKFAFDDSDLGLSEKWFQGGDENFDKNIIVPYTYQGSITRISMMLYGTGEKLHLTGKFPVAVSFYILERSIMKRISGLTHTMFATMKEAILL